MNIETAERRLHEAEARLAKARTIAEIAKARAEDEDPVLFARYQTAKKEAATLSRKRTAARKALKRLAEAGEES